MQLRRETVLLGTLFAFATLCMSFEIVLYGQGSIAPKTSANLLPDDVSVIRFDKDLDAIVAPRTRVEKVAGGFKFTEGPMWRDGRLWLSDVVGDQIFSVALDGSTKVLVDKAGGYPNPPAGAYLGPTAMAADKDGTVLLAQQGGRAIVRITSDFKLVPFLDRSQGLKFNSPNDLVFAPDGSLWFTDPPYGLARGDRDPLKEQTFNAVYRYNGRRLIAVIKDLMLPNGIGFSPDGKTLYVSNSGPNMCVMQYQVMPNGTVSKGKIFIDYPKPEGKGMPDGLKVDSAGNVWTTGPGGIRIISATGKVLGQIKLPETAANLAWGDDGKTAYITAQTSVYRLRMLIPGEMPLYRK
jgi:gluconolactonase